MKHAPLPSDEPERLAALQALQVLDTDAEDRFDRLVAFAAAELDVPIALISLVDTQRQWFKAKFGLGACETPRNISFCGHAIQSDEPFVVEDAALDARFADNPLVTGPPHLRFYVGIPLALPSGHRVGTFCVIDTRPRHLDELALGMLKTLQQLALQELLARQPVALS